MRQVIVLLAHPRGFLQPLLSSRRGRLLSAHKERKLPPSLYHKHSAVLCVCDGVRFGQLCSGNSENSRRTSDRWGQGHYGARRGSRTHKGLDIVCSDGSTIYAPFDVTLRRRVIVYTDPSKEAINSGIEMSGEGLCFKLFYVQPDKTSGSVLRGQKIGTMLPMQDVYPGITSHVHVQMCDQTDPTAYF